MKTGPWSLVVRLLGARISNHQKVSSQLVCSILSRNLAFWSKVPETQIFSMKHSSVSKFILSDEIHLTEKVQFPFIPLRRREWTIKISMLTLQQEAQVKRVEMWGGHWCNGLLWEWGQDSSTSGGNTSRCTLHKFVCFVSPASHVVSVKEDRLAKGAKMPFRTINSVTTGFEGKLFHESCLTF